MLQSCQLAVPAVANAASVADFIVAYGMVETTELSNLDSSGSTIDCDRFNKALVDAYNWLQSKKLMLSQTLSAVIDLNLNRWMLQLARYYLDTIRRRPDVTYDYEKIVADIAVLERLAGNSFAQYSAISSENLKERRYTDASLARFRSTII